MTFNSWEFLLFYPIVLGLYFLLPHRFRWPMLLIASYFFYMYYSPSLVFLILFTTLVSWVMARIIERSERRSVRIFALTVALVTSLGVLFFYKYFDFLSESIFSLFGRDPILLDLVLPVGISFYTFQTLSYVIDVYRGEVECERNFFFYALFVSFFPQLVAGPIERPGNLIPQLKEEHKFSSENAIAGARQMLLGFFKKICVADLVSGAVNAVYNSPEEAGSLSIVIATILFSIQIYCDFSGYTDIAIGCSRIMGIRLMKNFDHPYRSTSIKEFWSRWHISLSGWLRDYLYFPLGGSRCKKWRHLLNLFIVFIISGIWHGAAWTFILWGAIHGIYQIVGVLTRPARDRLVSRLGFSTESAAVVWVRRIITFALVAFSWLFFRANSISDAFLLVTRLFTSHLPISDSLSALGLDLTSSIHIILSVILLILLDRVILYEDTEKEKDPMRKGGILTVLTWTVLIVWTLLLSEDMISTFIYFAF